MPVLISQRVHAIFFLDSDDLIINKTLIKSNKMIEKNIFRFCFFPSYDPINKIKDNNYLNYKKKIRVLSTVLMITKF